MVVLALGGVVGCIIDGRWSIRSQNGCVLIVEAMKIVINVIVHCKL